MQKIKNIINTPIRKNILANLFGIGVNLLNQIVLVPCYLYFWGTELYSDWIVISALTLIFSMTNIGLNSVILNRYNIKYSEGNFKECNSLIILNYIVVSFVFFITLIVAFGFLRFFNIIEVLDLRCLTRSEADWIFVLLIAAVFLNMYSSITTAIFSGVHRNAQAVFIEQISKLSTFIVTIACLIFRSNLLTMCWLLLLPPIVCAFVKYLISRRIFRINFRLCKSDWQLFKTVLVQGLGFMSFPICNAILLQGFTLIVNRFFGADLVVLFNTTRTMCNFIRTLLNTVLNSVWPEFSIAYGKKLVGRMKELYWKSIKVSMFGAVLISIFLLIFGPVIYKIWTNGAVTFDYSLMIAFLIVLIVNTFWNTGSVVLLSTNNHIRFGMIDLGATILSFVTGYWIAYTFHSLSALVYCMLIIDLVLTFYVNLRFKKLLLQLTEC